MLDVILSSPENAESPLLYPVLATRILPFSVGMFTEVFSVGMFTEAYGPYIASKVVVVGRNSSTYSTTVMVSLTTDMTFTGSFSIDSVPRCGSRPARPVCVHSPAASTSCWG